MQSGNVLARRWCCSRAPPRGANEFPSRADGLIVGFAAGGGGTYIARRQVRSLSEAIEASRVIDNRQAGGNVGPDAVGGARDGYTSLGRFNECN